MNEMVFDIEKLRAEALDQHGYVTAAQAADVKVTPSSLSMLVKRGRLSRVAHGVYRVPQVAPTSFDRFMLALLWTGCEEAALSHETALDAYGVCDVNPTAIHVVVGASRRIRRSGGEGYVVHRQDIPDCQVGWWEGMRCVKLAVAIQQCFDAGTPRYLLVQAVENGRRKGLLTMSDTRRLERLVKGHV